MPEPADATWAAAQWPGTTPEDLQRGRSLYVAKCQSCHALPDPASQPSTEWDALVAKMADRAKLTADERTAITRYVTAISARPAAPKG